MRIDYRVVIAENYGMSESHSPAPPDLLAACKELLDYVRCEYGIDDDMIESGDEKEMGVTGAVGRATVAIAKATGARSD